jgi:signal transduction histidine kinase
MTPGAPLADPDRSRHDFKNQLAIIRGFSEILIAESAPDDPRRNDLEEIHRAAVAALALLDRAYPSGAADLSVPRG